MKHSLDNDKLSVGEVVFTYLGLGACGGLLGGAVVGMVMCRSLSGFPYGLPVAVPGGLVGAALGGPVAVAGKRRLGWVLAASVGALCGAVLVWLLIEAQRQLGGSGGS